MPRGFFTAATWRLMLLNPARYFNTHARFSHWMHYSSVLSMADYRLSILSMVNGGSLLRLTARVKWSVLSLPVPV